MTTPEDSPSPPSSDLLENIRCLLFMNPHTRHTPLTYPPLPSMFDYVCALQQPLARHDVRNKRLIHQLTNERRWQPLMSTNDLGYITTQEHVTPYIGVTARFYGFNSTADEEAYASRWLEPPSYTYR